MLGKSYEESYDNLSDEALLARSLKQPSLYQAVIDRYHDAFCRKVRSVIGSRDEVDDIVQETFLKIYMNGGKFEVREGASFKSWGYKILMNTTFTYYQKLKKDAGATVVLETEFYESLPDENEPQTEMVDLVASVLTRMPAHFARILKLHFLDGMPQKELAEKEGISISALKTRVHRAKKEYKKIHSNIT